MEPAWLPPRLDADPNGASYGFEYRGAVRGRFSDAFEFYGGADQAGYGITFAPLFELHEPRSSHNVLPSQYWRARVALEQSYGWFAPSWRLRLAWQLNHESDHETAHPYSKPGFIALNDVLVRLQLALRRERWTLSAALEPQLFLLSCTEPSRRCRNFRGDTSVGGQAQLAFALPAFTLWRFSPYGAAAASGIVAHRRIEGERRLSARLGAYAHVGHGVFALFALLWVGNDVGVVRHRKLAVLGVGVSFAR